MSFCTAKYSKFLASFINSVWSSCDNILIRLLFRWLCFIVSIMYDASVYHIHTVYLSMYLAVTYLRHVLLPFFFSSRFQFCLRNCLFSSNFFLVRFVNTVRKGLKWQNKIETTEHLLLCSKPNFVYIFFGMVFVL